MSMLEGGIWGHHNIHFDDEALQPFLMETVQVTLIGEMMTYGTAVIRANSIQL